MKKRSPVFSRLFMALVFLFLYAPIFVLMVFSFNDSKSRTVWTGFTLDWYVQLFRDREIMSAVYVTLLVSVLATVIATVFGTFAAIGFYNLHRRWRSPLLVVNNMPLMNADIVTGVSLCLFFVGAIGLWNGAVRSLGLPLPNMHLGFGTLLLAHISFNVPYVILSIMPKLQQMDKNLMDAAQDLGCTWLMAFWKVVVPEIKPGIINGMLIAFTMSVDDFVISYFTAGSTTANLAMVIYGMTKKRISPKINAISTLLFVTVLTLLIVVNVREARQARALQKKSA